MIDRYDVKLASKYDQEFCEAKLRKCFVPSQNLSVDEAMIQFNGRLAWKQFVPKKPINVGALVLQELLSQCIIIIISCMIFYSFVTRLHNKLHDMLLTVLYNMHLDFC